MIVNLLLTVDVDNDGIALNNERNELSWRAIARIPDIKRVFDEFGAVVTWFVRADDQLRAIYGSAAYLHIEHCGLWRDLATAGDEIGWHPHLYAWDEARRAYLVDTDEIRCAMKLRSIHNELRARSLSFDSVRVGEAFHGNALMRALCELGLKVDTTAIPGRRRADKARIFDWSSTPNEPYYPSTTDYRVPGEQGQRLPILEVPLTTMPVRAGYDAAPLKRYINLTYHHALFKAGFDAHLKDETRASREELYVTTILHPEEVCARSDAHPLYSYSLAEARRNLNYMLDAIRAFDSEVRFLRMSDASGAARGGGGCA
jgi:hypothetical protein